MLKVGILGAGGIACAMAKTISQMPSACCFAVASRDLEKARKFAEKWGIKKAYGSYEEMLSDPGVDLVYVATPHSHHYPHVRLCLEHGKHVLCEKAFTVNAAQARELFRIAKDKRLLLTEAMWTRYLPMRGTINEVLRSGIVGKPWLLTANLGYMISDVERLKEPSLAGGALLDVGVYPLNFAAMVFGNDPVSMERFDITAMVRNYLQSAKILAQQHGIDVRMDQTEPVYVWGDEFKTEEVLMNFYSNAVNHCEGEKVIEVKITCQDGHARVSVFNTGTPIPQDSLPHLWEKFYKVDKARTREYGGSGVGLSIVKAIMESMNQKYGVINYENGVSFWFELEQVDRPE